MKPLEATINYTFSSEPLLVEALTHSSYANEQTAKGIPTVCNERLEFLGDAVLSLVASERIFNSSPDMTESQMSRIRRNAVNKNAFYVCAKKIDLGQALILGKGEEKSGGRENVSNLENAFEALAGAVFLDGGLDAARSFALRYLDIDISKGEETDPKTLLQQIVQQKPGEVLEYAVISACGPDHDAVFTVEARLNSNVMGTGRGKSRHEAEIDAAKNALVYFDIKL